MPDKRRFRINATFFVEDAETVDEAVQRFDDAVLAHVQAQDAGRVWFSAADASEDQSGG